MKKFYSLFFYFLFFVCQTHSQNGKVVIGNGAFMSINSPATLIVNNNLQDAITRPGNGHIISEGESNKVEWVIGEAAAGNIFTFPFGKGTSVYVPFSYEITTAGTGPSGIVTASTWNSPANSVMPSGVVICGAATEPTVLDRFWVINPSGFTTAPTVTAKFYYDVTEDDPTSIGSSLLLQLWNSSSSLSCKWEPSSGSWEAPNILKLTGISNFSGAGGAAGSATPLPIELLSFDAVLNESVVDISWVTASEVNNDYFTLERSQDAFYFSPIDTIDGSGTTSAQIHYYRTDHNPLQGVSYYRLKQTDFNGLFSYSNTISVNFTGIEIIAALPNPAVESVTFIINTSEDMDATYSITDVEGRLAKKERVMFSKGITVLKIDITSLAQAVYIIKIVSDDNKYYSSKHFMRTK